MTLTLRPLFLNWLKRVRVPCDMLERIAVGSWVRSSSQVRAGLRSLVWMSPMSSRALGLMGTTGSMRIKKHF